MKDFFKKIKDITLRYKKVLIFYLLLQGIFTALFFALFYFVKMKLLENSSSIFDIEVLKNLNIDIVAVAILLIPLYLIYFIFKSVFLKEYFLAQYKHQSSPNFSQCFNSIFWRFYYLLKAFLVEIFITVVIIIVYAGLFTIFYATLGLSTSFLVISGLFLLPGLYFLFLQYIRFFYIDFYILDNTRKTFFRNFFYTVSKKETKKVFIAILKYYLVISLILITSSAIAYLSQIIIIGSIYIKVLLYTLVYIFLSAIVFVTEAIFFIHMVKDVTKIFLEYSGRKNIIKNKKVIISKEDSSVQQWFRPGYFSSIIFFIVIMLGGVVYSANSIFHSLQNSQNIHRKIFAHRGFSEKYVQNSQEAFVESIGLADAVELDVQLTKDGQVIVFHDKNFADLTGQVGIPSQRNYSEIRQYNISEFKPALGKTLQAKIPTLDLVLQKISPQIKIDIEIKNTNPARMTELVQKVHELILSNEARQQVMISSLDYNVLQEMKKIDPSIPRGLILSYYLGDILSYDVDFYSMNSALIDLGLIKKIHRAKRNIYIWNFDFFGKQNFEREYTLGVDGFIVNNPIAFRQEIEEYSQISLRKKFDYFARELFTIKPKEVFPKTFSPQDFLEILGR